MYIPVPEGLKAKDLTVKIGASTLLIEIQKGEDNIHNF